MDRGLGHAAAERLGLVTELLDTRAPASEQRNHTSAAAPEYLHRERRAVRRVRRRRELVGELREDVVDRPRFSVRVLRIDAELSKRCPRAASAAFRFDEATLQAHERDV